VGHCIHAFFGHPHVLADLAGTDRVALIVPLTPEVAALPVVWPWLREAHPPDGGLCAAGPFLRLTAALEARAVRASHAGPVAYVETDYFGGIGEQRAIAWRNGAVCVAAAAAEGQVDRALAAIGVVRASGLDEWDTLGLIQYRHDETFYEKAGVPFPEDEPDG